MNLLDFGFQSTYTKLLEMCGPNGALLDGRSDLDFSGQLFDPPTQRSDPRGRFSSMLEHPLPGVEMLLDVGPAVEALVSRLRPSHFAWQTFCAAPQV